MGQDLMAFTNDKKEISKKLNVSIGSVTNCLKKLRENKAINFKETKRKNQYMYRFKRQ